MFQELFSVDVFLVDLTKSHDGEGRILPVVLLGLSQTVDIKVSGPSDELSLDPLLQQVCTVVTAFKVDF